ncbi:MAG: hypothetical protein ABFD97_06845 [Syntrophobacter sp.]
MRKFSSIIFIAILLAFSVWPTPKAEALMYRGVYVNGEVHYLSVGADAKHQTISHQSGKVDSNFSLALGKAVTQDVNSCTPDFGSLSENAAVFDQKIFFAYTGNPGCKTNSSTGLASVTHLYVIAWDLTSGDFVRANGVNSAYVGPKDLGPVYRTDSNTYGKYTGSVADLANAAIVVFNGLLYVFADNGTYTSADGVNWSSHPALQADGTYLEPLDAIPYYPPDADPLIMIIYGSYTTNDGGYASLHFKSWNGQFGAASVIHGSNINILSTTDQTGYFHRCLGLFAGTESPAFTMLPGNDFNGSGGFKAGAKTPALQLFLGFDDYSLAGDPNFLMRLEYSYNSSGGAWTLDPEVFLPNTGGYDYATIRAFPWFTPVCNPDTGVLVQHLVIDTTYSLYESTLKQVLKFTSDAMVPVNADIPPTCANPGGTATDTGTGVSDEQNATLRKYWTLVGMVMGSPPFAVNNSEDFQLAALSNVTYGQNDTSEVSNSQETDKNILVSAGITVQAGLGRAVGFKDKPDASYRHAWESANGTTTTSTVSYAQTFGTQYAATDPNDAASIGTMGWAFFHVPTIVVQDYALYAYDYDTTANTGTPLNQDITTTQVNQGDLSFRPAAFELANPGGPNDDFPGLLSGVAPLTNSTDLTGWTQGWESNSATNHYKTLLGDSTAGETKINTISFGGSTNGSVSYSKDKQTITTSGETSDVEAANKASLSTATWLKGLHVDAGYDGHFSNSMTTTTTLGTTVEAALGMPTCSEPGCIKSLTVQPYLLQATDANAPWIPAGYNSQLPWAMHWKIVSYTTVGGGQSGASPLPDMVSGKVVGRTPPKANAPEGEYAASGAGLENSSGVALSSYSLNGGKMAWLKPNGKLKPIPMKARQFVPAQGASVALNGYTWSSSEANGGWVRRGNVWIFKTSKSESADIVLLKLDFGRQTWDFDLSSSDLSPFLKASDGRAHLKLKVNDKYTFYFDCDHRVKTEWDHIIPATASEDLQLSRYRGSFDQSTGIGTATLKGTLPISLTHFGDFSISVNGRQFNIPLLSHKDYANAFAQGSALVYSRDGLALSVDFGGKTWKIQFNEQAFRRHLVPRAGAATIQVKVGGEPWYMGQHSIRDYTSRLDYGDPGSYRGGGAGIY